MCVDGLTSLILQAADISLELPEVLLLRARLEEGEALQVQLTEALAADGDDRADVATLRDLAAAAHSCGLALQGAQRRVCSAGCAAAGAALMRVHCRLFCSSRCL